MYFERNIQARLSNLCCCGKARIISYSECVYIALVIENVRRMRRIYIVISGMSGLTIFYHNIKKKNLVFSERSYWTRNVYFDFLYNFRLKRFSF